MIGSTYNPPNITAFVKTAISFDANGVSSTMAAGTTTTLDYTLTDDCLLTGLELIINGGNYGDNVDLQIFDITGAFSGTPNTVLLQSVTSWYVCPTADTQFDLAYPAKILSGMTLRAIYHSTGVANPFLAVNYKLHKCLV